MAATGADGSSPTSIDADRELAAIRTVRDLLGWARLSQYGAVFEEQGFDDLEFLIQEVETAGWAVTLQLLCDSTGIKPGHAAKLRSALDNLRAWRHAHGASPSPAPALPFAPSLPAPGPLLLTKPAPLSASEAPVPADGWRSDPPPSTPSKGSAIAVSPFLSSSAYPFFSTPQPYSSLSSVGIAPFPQLPPLSSGALHSQFAGPSVSVAISRHPHTRDPAGHTSASELDEFDIESEHAARMDFLLPELSDPEPDDSFADSDASSHAPRPTAYSAAYSPLYNPYSVPQAPVFPGRDGAHAAGIWPPPGRPRGAGAFESLSDSNVSRTHGRTSAFAAKALNFEPAPAPAKGPAQPSGGLRVPQPLSVMSALHGSAAPDRDRANYARVAQSTSAARDSTAADESDQQNSTGRHRTAAFELATTSGSGELSGDNDNSDSNSNSNSHAHDRGRDRYRDRSRDSDPDGFMPATGSRRARLRTRLSEPRRNIKGPKELKLAVQWFDWAIKWCEKERVCPRVTAMKRRWCIHVHAHTHARTHTHEDFEAWVALMEKHGVCVPELRPATPSLGPAATQFSASSSSSGAHSAPVERILWPADPLTGQQRRFDCVDLDRPQQRFTEDQIGAVTAFLLSGHASSRQILGGSRGARSRHGFAVSLRDKGPPFLAKVPFGLVEELVEWLIRRGFLLVANGSVLLAPHAQAQASANAHALAVPAYPDGVPASPSLAASLSAPDVLALSAQALSLTAPSALPSSPAMAPSPSLAPLRPAMPPGLDLGSALLPHSRPSLALAQAQAQDNTRSSRAEEDRESGSPQPHSVPSHSQSRSESPASASAPSEPTASPPFSAGTSPAVQAASAPSEFKDDAHLAARAPDPLPAKKTQRRRRTGASAAGSSGPVAAGGDSPPAPPKPADPAGPAQLPAALDSQALGADADADADADGDAVTGGAPAGPGSSAASAACELDCVEELQRRLEALGLEPAVFHWETMGAAHAPVWRCTLDVWDLELPSAPAPSAPSPSAGMQQHGVSRWSSTFKPRKREAEAEAVLKALSLLAAPGAPAECPSASAVHVLRPDTIAVLGRVGLHLISRPSFVYHMDQVGSTGSVHSQGWFCSVKLQDISVAPAGPLPSAGAAAAGGSLSDSSVSQKVTQVFTATGKKKYDAQCAVARKVLSHLKARAVDIEMKEYDLLARKRPAAPVAPGPRPLGPAPPVSVSVSASALAARETEREPDRQRLEEPVANRTLPAHLAVKVDPERLARHSASAPGPVLPVLPIAPLASVHDYRTDPLSMPAGPLALPLPVPPPAHRAPFAQLHMRSAPLAPPALASHRPPPSSKPAADSGSVKGPASAPPAPMPAEAISKAGASQPPNSSDNTQEARSRELAGSELVIQQQPEPLLPVPDPLSLPAPAAVINQSLAALGLAGAALAHPQLHAQRAPLSAALGPALPSALAVKGPLRPQGPPPAGSPSVVRPVALPDVLSAPLDHERDPISWPVAIDFPNAHLGFYSLLHDPLSQLQPGPSGSSLGLPLVPTHPGAPLVPAGSRGFLTGTGKDPAAARARRPAHNS